MKLPPFAVAVLFVAVAGLWTGTPAAQAACGDYVHLGGNLEINGMADHAAGAPADLNATGPARELPASPCRGPHCRRQAPPPDLPVPVSYSSGPDEKALATEIAGAATENAAEVPASADAPRSDCSGGRLERPPRLGS